MAAMYELSQNNTLINMTSIETFVGVNSDKFLEFYRIVYIMVVLKVWSVG